MKRIPWIIFFSSLFISVSGQRNADYGVFGGVSTYIGDINPGRLIYAPLPAAGVLYRYNFHPRQALRANIFYGGLRGRDMDFANNFQTVRDSSFSGSVGELAVQFEFNFLPFTTQGRLWDFSPYFAAGAGVAYINSTTASDIRATSFQPVIPFSIGFKINIHKNMGLEAEYGFRKTFYDNFDGLNDMVAQEDHGLIHNNDWYSFAGIVLTWKIYNRLKGCPAYADVDGKRRR
ncbi:MAG TPA: hypothetical protein DDW27_02520 [Bacteroidales bacterium]|nr:hypothetical protein [Bacteroidales bacterium]